MCISSFFLCMTEWNHSMHIAKYLFLKFNCKFFSGASFNSPAFFPPELVFTFMVVNISFCMASESLLITLAYITDFRILFEALFLISVFWLLNSKQPYNFQSRLLSLFFLMVLYPYCYPWEVHSFCLLHWVVFCFLSSLCYVFSLASISFFSILPAIIWFQVFFLTSLCIFLTILFPAVIFILLKHRSHDFLSLND